MNSKTHLIPMAIFGLIIGACRGPSALERKSPALNKAGFGELLSLDEAQNSLAQPEEFSLEIHQRLPTSGARGVELFKIDGVQYLAIPQLAKDIPGQTPDMNAGDSDLDTMIFRWQDGQFVVHQAIPEHGAEHAEYFEIGDRKFLAIASIRSGSGPFTLQTYSTIYEWDSLNFVPMQKIKTVAAKDCLHFNIGEENFLAFANGVVIPGVASVGDTNSKIYRFDGSKFVDFQTIPSSMGYGFTKFSIGSQNFLGFADNLTSSKLYLWDGEKFGEFQEFSDKGGRGFTFFERQGERFLIFANLINPSTMYRWDGQQFSPFQVFDGLGSRRFVYHENDDLLIRINFITGAKDAPKTELDSAMYKWGEKQFQEILTFKTFGGTDAKFFTVDGKKYIAVSNSLNSNVTFKVDSIIYRY